MGADNDFSRGQRPSQNVNFHIEWLLSALVRAIMNQNYKAQDSRYAWCIWGLGAAFFLVEYLARVAPGVMVPELMGAFHINATSLGAFSALFYYAYVGMQLPVGTLMDKFGPHRLLTVTAMLCAIGCFLFAATESLWVAKIGRFMTGFGAAFAFIGTLKLATLWFSPYRFGLLAGATQALGMLGAAFGQGPTSLLVIHLGWRQTLWLIGGILLILAVLIGIFVRDREKSNNPNRSSTQAKPEAHLWPSLIVVFKNPQTWLVAVFAGLLYAPTAAFAEFWGTTYLVNVYGLKTEIAATGISAIFLGWAVGGPIAGWISDRIQRRKPIMMLSGVFCLITMSMILFIPKLPLVALFALLFIYGVCNIAVATAYAVSCEINPRRVSGTSMAFTNMASVLVGSAFHPLIGKLLDMRWDGVMVEGARVFSVSAYQQAMVLLPLCFVLCIIICLFIKETHCKVLE